MNIEWKDIFNTSHKRYGWISDGAQAAANAGYSYYNWSGRIYKIDGHSHTEVCLESEVGSVRIVKPLVPGMKASDIMYGTVNFCSWNRLLPQLSEVAGGKEVIGVRATNDGLEIVLGSDAYKKPR